MKNACEGVLYPVNAASTIKINSDKKTQPLKTVNLRVTEGQLCALEVSHSSWLYCKDKLEEIFSNIKVTDTVFLLAPLHKGPINFDDGFKIYCPEDGKLKGSDWEIKLKTPREIKEVSFVEPNDDVCTEEHSLEVIAPFIYKRNSKAEVCYLLAPSDAEEICEITSIIGRLYSNSIIFLSNNEAANCAHMWLAREGKEV